MRVHASSDRGEGTRVRRPVACRHAGADDSEAAADRSPAAAAHPGLAPRAGGRCRAGDRRSAAGAGPGRADRPRRRALLRRRRAGHAGRTAGRPVRRGDGASGGLMGIRRGRAAGRSRRAVRASRRSGQEPPERHPRRTRCTGRRGAGRGGGGGHRRARDRVRALAAADGAGRGGAGGGAAAGGGDRPAVGAADAAHPAPGAGLHVADRAHHRAPGAGALAGAVAALVALPRRRTRPADAACLQPRRGSGGAHRPGRRALPQGDHGDAAPCLSVRCGTRSGGHAGSGVDRGHGGSAAGGR